MFNMQERIADIINKEIENNEIAGANLMVIHKGEEIFFDCFGYADKEKKTPIKRDTIFRLFSMTKPITAVATMILVERGIIDVRDAVSKYIPAFANQKVITPQGLVPANRDITIWDCLNMTTGIPYPDIYCESGRQMDKLFQELKGRQAKGERPTTLDYVNRIAEIPLEFQPGESKCRQNRDN